MASLNSLSEKVSLIASMSSMSGKLPEGLGACLDSVTLKYSTNFSLSFVVLLVFAYISANILDLSKSLSAITPLEVNVGIELYDALLFIRLAMSHTTPNFVWLVNSEQ